jgi:zinc transport system substrate-binding protein
VLSRIVLVLLALGGLAASGCGSSGLGGGTPGPEVVAAFYPLAYAAEQIGAGGVQVENLTPAGAEPHDIELSPRDVERIQRADVVLYVGSGFMPQLEAVVAGRQNALDVLDEVDAVPGREGADPHVWLDPVRYAAAARRVAEALGSHDGAERFVARLDDLDAELRSGLADCERREIVTSHAAFGYLADRYGLEQVALAGLAPEAEPSPGELESLVDAVRRSGATTVFVEPLVPPAVAETVAREAGVGTTLLDPIEGLGEEELSRGADYFSVMRKNLRTLREALGCR